MVILAALVSAHLVVSRLQVGDALAKLRVSQGLLAFDGGWYQSIAAHGYAGAGEESLRFFPLLPYLAHGLSWLGPSPGVAVLLIANISALLACYLAYRLASEVLGGAGPAERSAWLLAFAPGAYALVLGYAEGLFLCLVLGTFLALRARGLAATSTAAVLALLAATCRPLGLALLPAIGLVTWKRWQQASAQERAVLLGTTFAPLAGFALVLANSAASGFAATAPMSVQTRANLHGHLEDPVSALLGAVSKAAHGHLSVAMHLPWIALAGLGLLLAWRLLPGELTIYTAGVLVMALSGTNLDSFERYATCAFPLLFVAAHLLRSGTWFRAVMVVLGAWLGLFSMLIFLNVAIA